MKPICLIIIIVFIFTGCSSGKRDQPLQNNAAVNNSSSNNYQAKAGSILPSFALQDANGTPLDLKSFAGKKIFVNLWATWCLPCRAEIPAIENLYRAADKNKAAFLLISLDNNFAKAKNFARRKKLTVPIYYPADSLPELFQVQGIPTTFIFNENGELQQMVEGAANYNTPAYRTHFGAAE